MKKFFNLILAALVIIGAAACTKSDEIVDQTQQSEGLSFYANVVNDVTRAYIDDTDGDKTWNTVWEGNETLQVGNYYFSNTKETPNKFTCADSNATELLGKSVIISGKDHQNFNSLSGNSAHFIWTNIESFSVDQPINLTSQISFLHYTYNGKGAVTLKLHIEHKNGSTIEFLKTFRKPNGGSFEYVEEMTFEGKGEIFVPFWIGLPEWSDTNATLSYSIDGVKCKETTIKNICWGKVYNLGTLTDPVKSKVWGTAGEHNNWTAGNPAPMYEMGDYIVAYNLAGGKKLKFVKIGAGGDGWEGAVGGAGTKATQANVWTDTGGNDIILPSGGPYDVYLLPSFKYCVVEAGKTPEKFDAETYDLYLKPNSNWMQANARFAAYFFKNDNSGNVWANMTTVADGIYGVNIPNGYTSSNCKVIFCRMNPSATANDWSNKWNQTGDLKIPTDGNLYTINNGSWDAGTWSVKQ